ncbi:ATP-binding protein [Streptomyces fulvorobeus]|uniref:Anti-sigma regulatory factor (Ser/Thr protein kinase) n=1 Tax=Streptomyces fulvorobeus TaxID=284028 RepID=A0A7J0CFC2_9ACTN|nr:ATP-binding protein [Streptomyces fulvorobeus]NYE44550.1 anti-sigma regulatory factor (Ser/Thr protein kinase) [Streptomyces fulvorobeus]GFN01089.1 hypothetical protein Sfulv_58990 [Streptomyces fulvorobeus]
MGQLDRVMANTDALATGSGLPGPSVVTTESGGRDARTGQGIPETAAEARARVTALLTSTFSDPKREALDEVVVADVLLVTSELVTNAIRHGNGLTGFGVMVVEEGLLLEVADASTERPAQTDSSAAGNFQPGGFGWPLICRLARDATITPTPDGKQITVLIPLS